MFSNRCLAKYKLAGKRLLTYYSSMKSVARLPSGDVFDVVGDPTRRRVLDLLTRGELSVRRIAAPFAMTRPAVSQHLRILLRARLIQVRRDGRERYYRLHAKPLREVYDWVAHFERFWQAKLKALGAFLDQEDAKRKGNGRRTGTCGLR
jgi:DNA-binding transcriptional ArsR family regulator